LSVLKSTAVGRLFRILITCWAKKDDSQY